MKGLLIAALMLMTFGFVNAQERVTEKKLEGIWELRIELRDDFLEEEIEEEDNALARVILKSVDGLVEGILDNLDIAFEFKSNGRCKVYVDAFGADEIEYTEWYINRRGQLIIEDTDEVNFGNDDYWMFEDDILVAYDDGERVDEDAFVYLVRVD